MKEVDYFMDEKKVNVFSEIGELKSVLIHRPGDEVENLTPEYLNRLLFDDIPFKNKAIEEHNFFANLLRKKGVEVLYIEELVAETLDQNPNIKNEFVDQFISEGKINKNYQQEYKNYLTNLSNLDMVKKMIAGTTKLDLNISTKFGEDPFIADPLPNVLFQRDPFASIGNGVALCNMWSETRNRETIFPDLVFKHNLRFKDIHRYFDRNIEGNVEGGDILVLNSEVLIIGESQRTNEKGIKKLAELLFKNSSYKKIIILELPKSRSFMHLDTVFTNIDYDKFLVHPLIFDSMNEFKIFSITSINNGKIKKEELKINLTQLLKETLGHEITLIRCGANDPIAAAREQWNDGTNVLAIAPGEVIAYDRNWVTNKLLKEAGIKINLIPSSELSRGRGGPRCMSMPLNRINLNKN